MRGANVALFPQVSPMGIVSSQPEAIAVEVGRLALSLTLSPSSMPALSAPLAFPRPSVPSLTYPDPLFPAQLEPAFTSRLRSAGVDEFRISYRRFRKGKPEGAKGERPTTNKVCVCVCACACGLMASAAWRDTWLHAERWMHALAWLRFR
jgi:hypothetical protein